MARLNVIILALIVLVVTAISFVVSYYVCNSFILNSEALDSLIIQLPLIEALTLLAFIIIGSKRGLVKLSEKEHIYNIFNVVCLANILTIITAVINSKVMDQTELIVPLSIIVLHSVLSCLGLWFSRYLYGLITLLIPKISKDNG